MVKVRTNNDPDFFLIDKHELDLECVNQPKHYHKYATQLANAKLEMEQAKTAIDVALAESDSLIRANPKRYKIEKITEAAVKAAILTSKGYTEAVDVYHQAKHKVDILQAAVTTLEHKKRMIEGLIQLQLADYFSRPQVRTSNRDDKDRFEQQSWKRLVEKGKRSEDDDG